MASRRPRPSAGGGGVSSGPSQGTKQAQDGVKVEFVYADGAKDDVQLSGDWNDWKAIQMFHEGGGMWSVVTPVPPGPHEFKFIVDGEWKHSNRHPTIGIDETSLNNVRYVLPEPDLSAERDGVPDPRTRARQQRAPPQAGGGPPPSSAGGAAAPAARMPAQPSGRMPAPPSSSASAAPPEKKGLFARK
mmetsp:Transcript_22477/g.38799  ORF Transcript_22477/g.38799 Transcript_22477/m.38799 type:complete len:188 (+) Transcript_22477:108-671(+)|eukprot:CAMPEP_0184693256 /NCGR_PEP_ID=MMETSP0313-20130426/1526_1 /TAXON_ID=2792 /ORGANISM="Porphyridium aerugineum, Strain SAG 1380-2" /LENGTH=187 /DNA_ID=CAMNT_0027151287 /DNA_START=93 /DNA_END=656 /DNA_ORIENTATION=-